MHRHRRMHLCRQLRIRTVQIDFPPEHTVVAGNPEVMVRVSTPCLGHHASAFGPALRIEFILLFPGAMSGDHHILTAEGRRRRFCQQCQLLESILSLFIQRRQIPRCACIQCGIFDCRHIIHPRQLAQDRPRRHRPE